MPAISLSSGNLHYQDHGQGRPVILLHANPGDSRDFAAVIPELAQHYRVLAVDWPGYGQSSLNVAPDNVTASFFTSVLRDFILTLGLPPVLLVPSSLRTLLSRFLRRGIPQLKVLAHSEVPDTKIIKVTSIIGGRT